MWDHVKILMKERGYEALQFSKQTILQEEIGYEPLREALRYFVEEFWFDSLHPTLISLACEAVGGNHKETIKMGAAIVLMAGAADIHDDIMDQSIIKEPNQTIFGKFGGDIAILAGDALLLKGIYLLHDSCESLPKWKKQEILGIVKRTFFEMSSGVAKEASLRGKINISGIEFLDTINQKVSTAEATTRIGAILGNGTENEIAVIGHYGRTLGLLLSLRDEFVDVFEANELKNRFEHECLPIPILLALQNMSIQSELLCLLKDQITDNHLERILDLSLDCEESKNLIVKMKSSVEEEIVNLSSVRKCKDVLVLLLKATLEDL